MKGFTIRAKFRAVPIFNNIEENSIIDLNDFQITFDDYYYEWLEKGIIENVKDIYILIKNPDPINAIMNNILKREYWRFPEAEEEYFLSKKWTMELVDFKEGNANGMFYVGGVVGKNLSLNYSMRFNPASSKLVNFHLFKASKEQL